MSQRAMKYLNDNRIVYRKYSDDEPTKQYSWGMGITVCLIVELG